MNDFFIFICKKCGSENVILERELYCNLKEQYFFGDYYIQCQDCGRKIYL